MKPGFFEAVITKAPVLMTLSPPPTAFRRPQVVFIATTGFHYIFPLKLAVVHSKTERREQRACCLESFHERQHVVESSGINWLHCSLRRRRLLPFLCNDVRRGESDAAASSRQSNFCFEKTNSVVSNADGISISTHAHSKA